MRLLHVDDGIYMGGATSEEISMIPVYQFKSTSPINIPLTTSTLLNHQTLSINNNNHTITTATNTNTNNDITKTSSLTPSPPIISSTLQPDNIDDPSIIQTTTVNNNNNVIDDDCHITIDLSKPDPQQQQHHRHKSKQQKPGIFDKLWLYLGLIDPPSESEPEYKVLEIPDVRDQVCVICLSTYEDGDILSQLW